jgi:predicted esterase/HEAT repeat protein
MTHADEEARLDAAMRRGDELLVDSLKRDDRARTRRRALIVLGAIAVIVAIALVATHKPQQQPQIATTSTPVAKSPDDASPVVASTQLASLTGDDWRRAFAVGNKLAAMPPDDGWAALQANWAKVPNFEARQQILKAFAFRQQPLHPRVLDVMHLGMTDPEPQVRAWAANYLSGLAYQDFAEDSSAYEKWRAATAGKRVNDVAADGATKWAERIKAAETTEQIKQEASFIRHVRNDLSRIESARAAAVRAGALDVAVNWLRQFPQNGDVVVGARDLLTALRPDEAYLKRVIVPMLDEQQPVDVRRAAAQTLGRADNKWAVDALLVVLRESVTSADKEKKRLIWDVASSLSDIGDPRAIPDMIGAIAHDNTYDTVYGVGYFGLGKMTGVRYDEKHDGAWWRDWWQRERSRFPEPARSSDIPQLDKTRAAQSEAGEAVRPIYAMVMAAPAADAADAPVPVEDLRAGGDESMRFFLIGPRAKTAPKEGYRLLLVLPGGDGSADFADFVKSIATDAVSKQYLVAQLVATHWAKSEENVWPIEADRAMKPPVTAEAFVDAVVADVAKRHKVDPRHIYALGWSSGGPAVYAAAMRKQTPITGAFVAMSVYKPAELPPAKNAKGRPFYILHSPQDFIRMTFPENARKQLIAAGAKVKLETYQGGHGWPGDRLGLIRTGIKWLESETKPAATRPTATTKTSS